MLSTKYVIENQFKRENYRQYLNDINIIDSALWNYPPQTNLILLQYLNF